MRPPAAPPGYNTGQPGLHSKGHSVEVGLQAVIARHGRDRAEVRPGGIPSDLARPGRRASGRQRLELPTGSEPRRARAAEAGTRGEDRSRRALRPCGGRPERQATGTPRTSSSPLNLVAQVLDGRRQARRAGARAKRRPATRYGCSTSATLTPFARATSFAATRSAPRRRRRPVTGTAPLAGLNHIQVSLRETVWGLDLAQGRWGRGGHRHQRRRP